MCKRDIHYKPERRSRKDHHNRKFRNWPGKKEKKSIIDRCRSTGDQVHNFIYLSHIVMMVAKVTPSSSGSTYPRLAVRLPCGSASINNTFFPSLARPIPKFTVVVVFPTPPFWFVMDITLHICCSSCILSSKFFITECFQIFINKIQIN